MALRSCLRLAVLDVIFGGALVMLACNGGNKGDDGAGSGDARGPTQPPGDGANGDSGSPSTAPTTASTGSSGGSGSSSGSSGAEVPVGPPAIRFIGRFDTTDKNAPTCAWPGCRIIANFEGTEVKVRLDEQVAEWMLGGPSQWDVTIDGMLQPKLVLQLGAHDYVLASGLPNGVHRVELYKRSEAQNGVTGFLGYDFGAGALLGPPPAASRRIELVGDSASAGFGIEGVGLGPDCPGEDHAAIWQNFHLSFGALMAASLDADLHGTVYSGKGLVRNIWRPDPYTMPILYGRTNPIQNGSVFDLTSFIPDVFIFMIGANDFAIGKPADNGPTPLPEFIEAARALVGTLRSRAPQAHIFLTLSPSVADDEPPSGQTRTNLKVTYDMIASERSAAGDTRIYSVEPPAAAKSELTGCNGHGNPAFHARVAAQLATMVKAKTGW